jgi:hypothetical protein
MQFPRAAEAGLCTLRLLLAVQGRRRWWRLALALALAVDSQVIAVLFLLVGCPR